MSEFGKRKLAMLREQQKLRRQAIWLQWIAGADARQLAQKYGVTRNQIYNLLTEAEKEQMPTHDQTV